MSIVRVCRHEEFELSHMLDKYNGKCGRIHGHTYRAEITLEGRIIEDPFSNSYGMLMDFNELKQIIKDAVLDGTVKNTPEKLYEILDKEMNI